MASPKPVKIGLPHQPGQPADQAVTQTRDYLQNQLDLWRDKITNIQSAIDTALGMYNDIMTSQQAPSLANAIFETVFMTTLFVALPEFACLKVIAEKLKWSDAKLESISKVVDGIRDVVKDSRETVKQSGENEEAVHGAMAARHYAIAYFQKMYASLSNISHAVTLTKVHLLKYLDSGNGNVPMGTKLLRVYDIWSKAGLEIPEAPFDSYQLALFFLYDIMRGYTKQSVSLKVGDGKMLTPVFDIDKNGALKLMNDGITNIEFEGLDTAKRGLMYRYFRDIKWVDGKRPPISNWKDLLKYWEFAE